MKKITKIGWERSRLMYKFGPYGEVELKKEGSYYKGKLEWLFPSYQRTDKIKRFLKRNLKVEGYDVVRFGKVKKVGDDMKSILVYFKKRMR